jgi:protein gp37
MSQTNIEWTDATWNPSTGCTKVSAGCANCYAERMAKRLKAMGQEAWKDGFSVRCHQDRLDIPLHWKIPRRIFVNSMSDLFHEDVPFEFIDQVFAVMALCSQHTFQVLTKRAERMAEYLNNTNRKPNPHDIDQVNNCTTFDCIDVERDNVEIPGKHPGEHWSYKSRMADMPWPLPNVWIGTSCENQKTADERIPHLLRCPSAVRFLSIEPMLGPISLPYGAKCFSCGFEHTKFNTPNCVKCGSRIYEKHQPIIPGIDWVIVGGESGPHARPMHPNWVRSIRDQCVAAGVPFFFKQWGEWAPFPNWTGDTSKGWPSERVGKKSAGRLLDEMEWDEMPEVAK